MKTQNSSLLTALLTLLAALLPATLTAQISQWTAGGGLDLNWSQSANWSSGSTPTSSSQLYFEDLLFDTGYTNAAKLVNNVVDANTAVGVMNYTTRSFSTTNRFYTTLIPVGITLTLGGLGAAPPAALAVGDIPGDLGWLSSGNWTNYSTITGPGTLAVNDSSTLISVGWRNRATLDLTGLDTFTANVGQVWVGASADNPNTTGPTGWLLLARTNTLTTTPNLAAPGVLLGHATNTTGTAVLGLGGVNSINTDGLVVGGRRSGSTFLTFGSSFSNAVPTSTLTLRGSAGGTTPIPVFAIGDVSAATDGYATTTNSSSVGATGTADFTGGTVDILADSIYIGRSARPEIPATGGAGTGTLIVEQGTVNATNIYIAYKQPGTTNATIGGGTLFLKSNAVVNVAKDLFLTFRTNGTAFINQPLLVVSNSAILNVGGNLNSIHSIGSWTPAAIALGGGAINLTGGGAVNVPTLQGFGNLTNASSVTITNALTIGTDATAATLNVGNNLTLGSAVKPLFNLGANTTVGGGVNDLLQVSGNVSFNANPITLALGAPLVAGTYELVKYGGTQSGLVTWTNPTRYPIGLEQNLNQHVAIIVTNVTPGNLVWQATPGSANWNNTSNYWNANTDKFYQLDNVVFDDSGQATNVTITGITNSPSSLTISNNTKLYTFTQASSGRITGFTDLTKKGTGTLVIGGGGTDNYFTGPVNINSGTIRIGSFNTGVFGTTGSTTPIYISAGGTLDINGQSIGSGSSYGRPIFVTGTGAGGVGAIANGAASNPTLTTSGVTMTGDTMFYGSATTRLILSGTFAPYAAVFDLGGFTLTTTGTEVRLSQMTMTNAGTINVSSPIFSVQNSIIAGAGNLNLGNNGLFFNSWTTGYVTKPITVNGGYFSSASAAAPTILIGSPITLNGALGITNAQPIRLTNVLSGTGSLTKYGNSNLVMEAANTYVGATTISAGRATLTSGGSLASSLIQVDAVLDVSAYGSGYNLASGQTLSSGGAGGVVGNINALSGSTCAGFSTNAGSVTVAANATVAPGSALVQGTLTVTNNLTFNGGTAVLKLGGTTTPGSGVNDLIAVGGNLAFTAPTVIRIQPVATLSGLPYTLFTYAGTLSGIGNVTVTSDSRYSYTLDTATPGEVRLSISGSAGNLVWQGGAPGNPNAWDVVTTANWLNGASPDKFYQGDSVTFDGSSGVKLVTISTQVKPASITNNDVYYLNGTGSLLAGNLVANAGGFVFANTNNNLFNGDGVIFNGGNVLFNQPTDASITAKFSGGSGSTLIKQGTNTLTLISSDSTNMTAGVTVSGGTLKPVGYNALGTSSVTVSSGGTLDINGQILNAPPIGIMGAGADSQGALNNRGTTQTNAIGNLHLFGDATIGAASNRWDISGNFTGNAYALAKTGVAEVRIRTGSGTGLGNIDVQAGRLTFSDLGTDLGDASGTVTVRTNAILAFANGIQAGGKPAVVQAGGQLYATGAANRFDGPAVLTNGVVLMEPNAGLTLGGNLSGPATLNLKGVAAGNYGILTLEGTNTYTGGTLVNEGQLTIANSYSLPTSSNVVLSSRSTFSSSGHPYVSLGYGVATPPSVMLDMQTVGAVGAAQASLGADGGTWSGAIKLTGNNANCRANFNADGTNGLTILQAVDGAGFTGGGTISIGGDGCDTVTLEGVGVHFNSSLVFTGNLQQASFGGSFGWPQMPKLHLASSGNYWSSTLFYRGVIQIGANNALPLTPITFGHAFSGDHRFILDLNGYNQTIADMRHTLLVGNDPLWIGNSSTNANSVLTYSGTGTNAWAAFIVDAFDTNAAVQHTTSLAVTAGRLRLIDPGFWTNNNANPYPPSGPLANTYTGPTTISGGTLQVDGVNLGVSPVTVSDTGTLGGSNGIFLGPVSIAAGGTLSPGPTIGTLFISNNLTLGGNALFEVNLNTSTTDKAVGINNLVYGGTLIITNVGAQAITNGAILKLFDAVSYIAGTVTMQPGAPAYGLRWDTSYLAVDGTLRVASVNTNATSITSAVSGGNLTLSWPADHTGWRLQGQTNSLSVGLTPNWFNVTGSTETNQIQVPIAPGNPAVFFRLVYP